MNSTMNEIVGRRAVLISRSAMQREQLARAVDGFEGPLRIADSVMSTTRKAKRHPALISALTALLVTTNLRRIARLPKRLYQGWLLMKVVRGFRELRGARA